MNREDIIKLAREAGFDPHDMREHFDSVGCGTIYKSDGEGRSPLYTAPTKREWVGLTDEERIALWGMRSDGPSNSEIRGFARAIEARLKEKNGG